MASLIGKRVRIQSTTHTDSGLWGLVKLFDGKYYHVALEGKKGVVLPFERSQIRVVRPMIPDSDPMPRRKARHIDPAPRRVAAPSPNPSAIKIPKKIMRELEAGRKLAKEIAQFVKRAPDGVDPSGLHDALAEHEAAIQSDSVDHQ